MEPGTKVKVASSKIPALEGQVGIVINVMPDVEGEVVHECPVIVEFENGGSEAFCESELVAQR